MIRKIAFWAKRNRKPAIGLLTILSFILGFLCSFIGNLLFVDGILLPDWIVGIAATLFVGGLTAYHFKQRTAFPNFAVRKTGDGLLVLAGMLFWMHFGNTGKTLDFPFIRHQNHVEQTIVHPNLLEKENAEMEKKSLKKWAKKWRRKAIFQLLKHRKSESPSAEQVILSLLLLAAAAGLGLVVLGLSCNLGCSGQIGASYAVLYFGGILIALLVLSATGAFRRYDEKRTVF